MAEGGQWLGKYRVLEELGAGGFATVYKALDTTLDREVALKILHPPLLTDRRFVQNFRLEARTLASLRHPHIVTVYEVGEIDGRLFIAMDLAHGQSLARSIAERGRIPWAETLALLKPVCEALDYAHGQNIVHRDLKPANLLLDTQRGALLTDFGFARLMAENSASMSLSGGIVGTPGYIAPEVWEENAASPPVDIYALGCIVYEMLTGDVLFKGQTPIQAMRAHDRGPRFPATWPGDIPAGITEVLGKALARDPAPRYASAGALWHALNDLEAERQAAREAEQRAALAAEWRAEAEQAIHAKEWDAARMAMGRWRAVAPDDPALGQAEQQLERLADPPAESGAYPAPRPLYGNARAKSASGATRGNGSKVAMGLAGLVVLALLVVELLSRVFFQGTLSDPPVISQAPSAVPPAEAPLPSPIDASTSDAHLAPTSVPAASLSSARTDAPAPMAIRSPTPPLLAERIVFLSDRDGTRGIFVMHGDGSNPTRLTSFSSFDGYPVWSPEGTKIVFSSAQDNIHELYVMNDDGSNLTRVTITSRVNPQPAWSPDGTKIVFLSEPAGNSQLYVINADGSNLTRLTTTDGNDFEPAWSPDGTRIAFLSDPDRDGSFNIYVINADGSAPTQLTTVENNRGPAWSPDGSKIAFTSDRSGTWDVYVMNADGSAQTRLTNDARQEFYAIWSPDGTQIAFFGRDNKPAEIYTITADGSKEHQLTDNSYEDFEPAWSPDSSKIAFVSKRDGNDEIYVMNADGSQQTNLTNNLGWDYYPDWSRNRT